MTRRIVDFTLIVTAAIIASAAIVLWHDRPPIVTSICAAILLALLARYHETSDLAGLAIGATVGNAIELICDAAGVWQHADRSVMGLAPLYIFVCYPILGLAMPRMIEALAGSARSHADRTGAAPAASALLILFVIASARYSVDHFAQSLVCVIGLALTLSRFRSRHDLLTAVAGALIAFVWEIPATMSGAWSFPQPLFFNLVPLWLPAAYAVFFVTMGRLTAVLEGMSPSMPWPRWTTPNPKSA